MNEGLASRKPKAVFLHVDEEQDRVYEESKEFGKNIEK